MPIYRADIRIKSDLVFPSDANVVTLRIKEGKYEISLRNASADNEKIVNYLDAAIVGPSDSFDEVGMKFRQILAEWLNSLSYVCQCRFVIKKVWRVIEWEPGQQKRKFKALNVFDPFFPPRPELSLKIVETANVVADASLPRYVRRAMHCFRTALLQFAQEDRFMQFWMAIEVLAEGAKEKIQVPIPCPKCRTNLFCKCCDAEPVRTPMANQPIGDLFREIKVPNSEETFRTLSKVRSGIAHGRSRDSIEKQIGMPISVAVETVGLVACNAIRKFVPSSIFKTPPMFKRCGGPYAAGELIAGPVGEFDQSNGFAYPSEGEIPDIKIDMVLVDEDGNEAGNTKPD